MSAAPTSDSPPLDAPRSELIETALRQASQFDANCPSQLGEAIRYSLLAPGKRLRPHLVLYAAEACGGAEAVEQALPAAVAVEMIHAYSLVHDDLPAMDDDDLRRGRPTCHKQFDEATAILVGDALLTRAFEILATGVQPGERAARCCAILAKAAGAEALVGGQADDLAAEFRHIGLERLQSIHRRKTGALFRASLELGAEAANGSSDQRQALVKFGEKLGHAFQIVDDLLDVSGSEENVGKRLGKDRKRGKVTYPSLLGVEPSRRKVSELIDEACGAIESFGAAAQPLRELAEFVGRRSR
ncbi:MAG: farnesyl-diphosphate synthase [Pirellula sp.]|nr:farnesyl-diphosphate synthase [Pirellula sp.]